MKKLILLLLSVIMMMPLPAHMATKKVKPPSLHLFTLQPGEVTPPIEGDGTWESEHPDIAVVSADGVITAVQEGYTLLLCNDNNGLSKVRAEVKVGNKAPPDSILKAVELAIRDWREAGGKVLEKKNVYTIWHNPAAKNGFGWCGAFVGYQFSGAGVPMDKAYRQKDAPPLQDGTPFAVSQASQTKLYEGFVSRNRISGIPQVGYYVVYGKKGSTPYTHIGLVTRVEDLGEGKFLLETVEGNLSNRIKRFSYVYDSVAERKERNIVPIPGHRQTQPETFYYDYVENFYLNVSGQTWY